MLLALALFGEEERVKGLGQVEGSCQSKATWWTFVVACCWVVPVVVVAPREATRMVVLSSEREDSRRTMREPTVPVPPRTRMAEEVILFIFGISLMMR